MNGLRGPNHQVFISLELSTRLEVPFIGQSFIQTLLHGGIAEVVGSCAIKTIVVLKEFFNSTDFIKKLPSEREWGLGLDRCFLELRKPEDQVRKGIRIWSLLG